MRLVERSLCGLGDANIAASSFDARPVLRAVGDRWTPFLPLPMKPARAFRRLVLIAGEREFRDLQCILCPGSDFRRARSDVRCASATSLAASSISACMARRRSRSPTGVGRLIIPSFLFVGVVRTEPNGVAFPRGRLEQVWQNWLSAMQKNNIAISKS